MKKKYVTLYIPVMLEKGGTTLVNASKVPKLKDILPDEETLVTHMQIQRIKVNKDNNYRPEPFEICIESSKFTDIITELRGPARQLALRGKIPLVTAWPGVPILMIVRES